MSAAASGCNAPRELSTPGVTSSIGMLPAAMLPAAMLPAAMLPEALDCTPGAPGLLTARSRSASRGTLRYAITFVPGARPVSGKR